MEKYTVIIPTRDRAETLEATIRTCLRQTYPNFEVIVSDNCSNDNTVEVVSRFKDSRLKYINPGRRLSMSGNFEYSLSHVADGFVMFIGSDDGIMPDAINYVNSIVERYKVDAVSCAQATYIWPNFFDEKISGKLTFGGFRKNIEIRQSAEWIKKTLSFESMYCFDLPNLYCGFVRKRIIDLAYKDGHYFRSITPDAYGAFATAIFLDSYAFSYKPFSIAGASTKSNGASALHSDGDKREANKFNQENDIKFYDGFVYCPSFEVICSEAFMQLAKAFPKQCKNYRVDYKKMLENSLTNSNKNTKLAVSEAVSAMMKTLPLDIHKKQDLNMLPHRSLCRLVTLGIDILFGESKVIEINNSHNIGLYDVDDAALAANLLMQKQSSKLFVTNKQLLFRRLKSKLFSGK
jgi:glycosyltransferase involved in cell wall biosynthesis